MLDGRRQHGVQVGDYFAYRLVLVSQRCSERSGLVEDVVDGGALALEHGDYRLGDPVDLVGIQRLEQRTKPTEQSVQIQGRLGVLNRDRAARGQQLAVVTALELQVAVADQVEVADRRGR